MLRWEAPSACVAWAYSMNQISVCGSRAALNTRRPLSTAVA
jgi:hypothetical protein